MTTNTGNNCPISPVVNQPVSFKEKLRQPNQSAPTDVWMPIPHEQLNAAFEYLAPLDGLLIQQYMGILETSVGFESNNRYVIKNTQEQIVFMAYEDTKLLDRIRYGTVRTLKILDSRGVEVIHISREMNLQGYCCPNYIQEMKVVSPTVELNGVVKQDWNWCGLKLRIMTNGENTDLEIDGPTCVFCSDTVFKVSHASGRIIGDITKWMGYVVNTYRNTGIYMLSFPQKLCINQKIMLMATTFLLDFMYFEEYQRK